MEACATLERFAAEHKIEICRAKLVGQLVILSQATATGVVEAAGRVLRLLV